MPVPALKSIGARHGVPLARMERFWAQARKDHGDDFRAVMGTVKAMAANFGAAKSKARARKMA